MSETAWDGTERRFGGDRRQAQESPPEQAGTAAPTYPPAEAQDVPDTASAVIEQAADPAAEPVPPDLLTQARADVDDALARYPDDPALLDAKTKLAAI